ncbi:MAG: ABC transporter permease [Vicinamibacterales bacterium]
MLQDLRLAVRSLRRAPVFTLVAGTLLALGVGAAIAVFTVVDGVLLKALPYPQPDRIVTVWEATERSRTVGVSGPNYRDWAAAARSFSALAAWGGAGIPCWAARALVTGVRRDAAVLCRLRHRAAPGRTFSADETREHGTPAVVVSHALWTRLLGANADLSSLSLVVNGRSAPVVGVMPPGFSHRAALTSGFRSSPRRMSPAARPTTSARWPAWPTGCHSRRRKPR